jgi:phosphatidate cytidylyltransferase
MGDWTPRDKTRQELAKRLVSAALLIPFALWVVYEGGWWLAAGCAVFAYAMMWEWGEMTGLKRTHSLAALVALIFATLPLNQPLLTILTGAAALTFALVAASGGVTHRLQAAFGVAYIGVMVLGLWLLRQGPWQGVPAALFFMSFVWASDAAAYFTGRAIGGPRLLPSESPNKTWSGAVGAVIACILCGLLAARIEGAAAWPWMLTGVCISVVAQGGDLFESALKRRFKVKDSSGLLPGHGGVLDRVDGLGAVAALGSLALFFMPALPRALGF